MSSIHKTFLILTLFFGFVLSGTKAHAQLRDTIRYSLTQRPKLFLNFVPFNSYINKNIATFSGIRAGVNFNRRVKFGLGYFALTNNSVVSEVLITDDGVAYTTDGELNFHFFSINAEYIFYNKYPWQFSFIPLQFGLGRASYDYIRRSEDARVATDAESVFIFYPDVSGQYNILNWLGAGASLGYRVTVNGSDNVQDDFNSPTFSITLKVFLDELYKMAFPNGLKGKKA
ncbi:MAG: hypothetical protein KA444_01560 [Bacteroidia bacterium]|nr:hypothetical protein [Bacteroidia bacterium]